MENDIYLEELKHISIFNVKSTYTSKTLTNINVIILFVINYNNHQTPLRHSHIHIRQFIIERLLFQQQSMQNIMQCDHVTARDGKLKLHTTFITEKC
jgi:hypothetical protein